MKSYTIHSFHTGFLGGSLNPKKLQSILNNHAKKGWRLARTIKESKRILLIFHRETHFLIFERDIQDN